jgi:twinkle protein
MFNFHELGIETGGRSGQIKVRCPQCNADRRNKRDRSLSVNTSTGGYTCHYCGWEGYAEDSNKRPWVPMPTMKQKQRPKNYTKPAYSPGPDPTDKLVQWFKTRGISEAVIRRNRIETRERNFGNGSPERCVAFPYIRDGEVVNVQYRTHDKRFQLESGAELIFYGIDDVKAGEPLIIVEGQIDKLTLEECGYANCVSLPNGWNVPADAEWLRSAEEQFKTVEYFILAGDNDDNGRKGMAELSRRLGPERCYQAEWPNAEWPEVCKDANETLLKLGKAAVVEAIETAQPLPIAGIVSLNDLAQPLNTLYETGIEPGVYPGWDNLAEYYRPRLGEWTLVLGAPGMGKSAVLDALVMEIAKEQEWRIAMYSPEQLPLQRHAASLLELHTGKPFNHGPTPRMTAPEMRDGLLWLNEYFTFIQPDIDDEVSVDAVLELARVCILRHGIRGLVIDPWNELEHSRPPNLTETEYVGRCLSKIRRFARHYGIHVWLLAHPTKLQRKEDGSYPVASPYDAAGSAHFFNKADMIISIWRNKKDETGPVEIHIQKVRFRENGKLGTVELYYDQVTGRLNETPRQYWQ